MQLLHTYTNYNLWANQKIIKLLNDQEESLLKKEVVSSFPSIWKTVLHLWDAELIWFSRLRGESFDFWPSEQFEGDKTDLLLGMLSNSTGFRDFAQAKEDQYFSEVVHYSDTSGVPFRQTAGEIIQHVINHSTFHRGQLITLLRQLGLTELPATDLIFYLREQA